MDLSDAPEINDQIGIKNVSIIFSQPSILIPTVILVVLFVTLVSYYLLYDAQIPEKYSEYFIQKNPKGPFVILNLATCFTNYVFVLFLYIISQKSCASIWAWLIDLSLAIGLFKYDNHHFSDSIFHGTVLKQRGDTTLIILMSLFYLLTLIYKLQYFSFLIWPFYGIILSLGSLDSSSLINFVKSNAYDMNKLDLEIIKVLKDFFRKTKFDRSKLFISENNISDAMISDFNILTWESTKFIHMSVETAKLGDPDLFEFILYHEYDHSSRNSPIFGAIFRIFKYVLIFLAMLIYAIRQHINSKSSFIYENINSFYGLLLCITFFSTIFEFLICIYTSYYEFKADDTSVKMTGNLNGLKQFINYVSRYYSSINFESLINFPLYFPIFDHPSVFHRFTRQFSKFKEN